MARKKVEKRIPSALEMYFACELLSKDLVYIDIAGVFQIIEGCIMNKLVDKRLVMSLRKYWLKMITAGLTEEEIDELVNK